MAKNVVSSKNLEQGATWTFVHSNGTRTEYVYDRLLVPRSPNPKDPALGLDAMHALLNPETGRCAMVSEKWLCEGPLGQAKSATGHNSHWLVREEAPSNADLVAAWREADA
jgi:hypothetical protein